MLCKYTLVGTSHNEHGETILSEGVALTLRTFVTEFLTQAKDIAFLVSNGTKFWQIEKLINLLK